MVKKIQLTEDHIKLIPMFFIQSFDDDKVGVTREQMFCLGSHLLEDMAMVLGLMDKAIPNTSENPNGRAFDDETEAYMLSLYEYLSDNLTWLESLIHQFVVKGGITSGTYTCKANEMIWCKVED